MTAKDIADWIQPVKDIREAKSLDDLLQRDLHNRQKAIANYLLTDNSRFFNSIIVGVFDGVPDWLEFDISKASNFVSSDAELKQIKESVGLLIFRGDEKMFAIDGQHRVAGISGAIKQAQEGANGNSSITEDQFSVIFVGHNDDELGKKRTRKLFSDINNNAKPVAGGDKIKIDEQDLNAIVARRIYAEYKHFKEGALIALTENSNLEKGDVTHFTNLLGLFTVNRILRKLFKKNPDFYQWEEENVVAFKNIVIGFYDFVIENVYDYKKFFIDNSLTLADARSDNKHILFRPIGLFLLAKLYVYYYNNHTNTFKLLSNISFVLPDSPYNHVLWTNGKMEAKSKNQTFAFNLTLYLLGESLNTDLLLEQYRDITKNDDASLPNKVF